MAYDFDTEKIRPYLPEYVFPALEEFLQQDQVSRWFKDRFTFRLEKWNSILEIRIKDPDEGRDYWHRPPEEGPANVCLREDGDIFRDYWFENARHRPIEQGPALIPGEGKAPSFWEHGEKIELEEVFQRVPHEKKKEYLLKYGV